MDFVTTKELRAESGKVWSKLDAGEEIVVTRNGKPFALIVRTEAAELEDNLRNVRATRFARLLAKQHAQAVSEGQDKTSMGKINEDIARIRQGRRKRAAGGR